MTSIHPRAVDWKPSQPPRGQYGAVVGRCTSYTSRLGVVWKSASGWWQATHYTYGDLGEHKTRQKAQRAIEEQPKP